MRRFWKEHDVDNKINLKFNRFGQPCGLKTCKLTNFIGTLVKGKEMSLAAQNWSKVPKLEKEKLWDSIQAFLNIDESYKRWVLRSASKKWKDFKVVLKRKYYKADLSRARNILNGCDNRIPIGQWEWLVKHWRTEKAKEKSERNKATRASQPEGCNGTHTAGSRSFAVVLDQMEMVEGREIGRAELYVVTHTKNNGYPVNQQSEVKMDEIKKRIREDPSLIGEEARDGDLYSSIFPKGKKGRPSGLGLLVGGVALERLAQVEAELHVAKQENMELRHVVHTLVANQTSMMAKSERMAEQYNELKSLIIASRGSVEMGGIPEKELPNKEPSKDLETMNDEEQATSLSYTTKASEAMAAPRLLQGNGYSKLVKASQLESKTTESALPSLAPVPKPKKTKTTKHKKPGIFQTPLQNGPKDGLEDTIKCGMEVSLTSPNSASVVAMGTIQKTDRKAKAIDGQPLADCVEVLINVVLKETTELPRAQGKINKLGNAQARCIPWPRKNIMQIDRTTVLHSKVSSVCSQVSFNNSENVDPNKTTTGTQVTNHETGCSTSEGAVSNTLKRKKVSKTTRMKKATQAISATTGNNILRNSGRET